MPGVTNLGFFLSISGPFESRGPIFVTRNISRKVVSAGHRQQTSPAHLFNMSFSGTSLYGYSMV